jgi:uncharacterized protein YhhL (DUF1145 family)
MVFEIFETLAEIGFVVQVLVFTYTLFWLYMTFRDLPLLFGLTSVLSGFLIFIHGISMTVLVASFVFLFLFGMQIQQVLWFGLFPLLGMHPMGDRLVSTEESDPRRMQDKMHGIETRIADGLAGESEIRYYEEQLAQQQMGGNAGGMNAQQQQYQRLMMGGG